MNNPSNKTAISLCLAAALAIGNLAQAQTTPAVTTQAAQQPAGAVGIFSRWDKDKNNALSLVEFQAGWQEVETAMTVRKLQETFALKDANKSGSLEAAEYLNLDLIKKAGSSAPPMAGFDADKNQRLDFKEYVAMLDVLLQKP